MKEKFLFTGYSWGICIGNTNFIIYLLSMTQTVKILSFLKTLAPFFPLTKWSVPCSVQLHLYKTMTLPILFPTSLYQQQ